MITIANLIKYRGKCMNCDFVVETYDEVQWFETSKQHVRRYGHDIDTKMCIDHEC